MLVLFFIELIEASPRHRHVPSVWSGPPRCRLGAVPLHRAAGLELGRQSGVVMRSGSLLLQATTTIQLLLLLLLQF